MSDNYAKLAEAMARVMDDASLRKSTAARGIEMRDRYSMARIGAMWDDLFRSLGADVDA